MSAPPVRRPAQTLTTPMHTSYPLDVPMVVYVFPMFPMTGWHTVGWEDEAACDCNNQPTTASSLEAHLSLPWNPLASLSNQLSAGTAAA